MIFPQLTVFVGERRQECEEALRQDRDRDGQDCVAKMSGKAFGKDVRSRIRTRDPDHPGPLDEYRSLMLEHLAADDPSRHVDQPVPMTRMSPVRSITPSLAAMIMSTSQGIDRTTSLKRIMTSSSQPPEPEMRPTAVPTTLADADAIPTMREVWVPEIWSRCRS